ncbi:MAG: ribonuclease P protein component [Phycisphaerae bacterium]
MATPPASPSSDPPAPRRGAPRLRFPRAARLSRKADFERALSEGARGGDDRMRFWMRRNDSPVTRLGIMVTRRCGGAVQRNRLKRVIREAFRLCRAEMPGGFDLVCSPRPGMILDLPHAMESLRSAVARLSDRAAAR